MVECINYKQINKGSLLGTFDVKVLKMGIIIYGLILFQKNGKRWISFPSRKYEKDGQTKYLSYIRFIEEAHMALFTEKVLKAIEKDASKSISKEELPSVFDI